MMRSSSTTPTAFRSTSRKCSRPSTDTASTWRASSARWASSGGEAGRRGKSTAKGGDWVEVKKKGSQKWVGYESTRAETEPIAFRQSGRSDEDTAELQPRPHLL